MSKKKDTQNTSSSTGDSIESKSTHVNQGASSKKQHVSLKEFSKNGPFSFNANNYKWLLIGLVINILGFILMIGGGSEDPNQFDAEALFSIRRITIAPIFIVTGYVIIIYAIMRKPKPKAPEGSN